MLQARCREENAGILDTFTIFIRIIISRHISLSIIYHHLSRDRYISIYTKSLILPKQATLGHSSRSLGQAWRAGHSSQELSPAV